MHTYFKCHNLSYLVLNVHRMMLSPSQCWSPSRSLRRIHTELLKNDYWWNAHHYMISNLRRIYNLARIILLTLLDPESWTVTTSFHDHHLLSRHPSLSLLLLPIISSLFFLLSYHLLSHHLFPSLIISLSSHVFFFHILFRPPFFRSPFSFYHLLSCRN